MTEEQNENLFRSLEGGDGGIEAFLNLPGDDRAWVMAVLEQRAAAEKIRQIVEQCEADGTMDKIRAFLVNFTPGKTESRNSNLSLQ